MGESIPQPAASDQPRPAAPLPLDYETPRPTPRDLWRPYTLAAKAFLWCAVLSPVLIGVAGLANNEMLSPALAILAAIAWLVALGLLVVAIAERGGPWHRVLQRLLAGLMALILPAMCVGPMILPMPNRTGNPSNRAKCASNLRQIANGILFYANTNNGLYPPDLATVLVTQQLGADCFICPLSADTPATGATTQQIATNLSTPGHLSYIYIGQGMTTSTATAETIVAYEPLKNHKNQGINILYGDGHVTWHDKQQAQYLLTELAAGHNPPRPQAPSPSEPAGAQ